MGLRDWLARQSARPQGWAARLLIGPYLDRSNARANALVFEQMALLAGHEVLEIGFGSGSLLLRMAESVTPGQVDGVEISAEMIAQVRRKIQRRNLGNVSLHQAGIESLPFDDDRFDRVCSVHSLYFWPDLASGIAEIARVLKPGGRLVLGFSAAEALRAEGWVERGFRVYANTQIDQALRSAGLIPEGNATMARPGGGEFFACCARQAA